MEKLLNTLEKKLRRFAIANLMKFISIGTLAFFVLSFFFRGTVNAMGRETSFLGLLVLDRAALFQGQIWRLISFVFSPPQSSPLFVLLSLYFYYFIGNSLEGYWGTARFNLYYLIGVVGTIIAALVSGYGANVYLNYSLFFAFAMLYPDMEVRIFFVLPVKIKYLAYVNAAFFVYSFVIGGFVERAAIVAALLNFFLFFGGDFITKIRVKIGSSSTQRNFRRTFKK